MPAITEVQKTYEIIAGNIHACEDYAPPADLNSNARGTSNTLTFALKLGDKITVIQHMRRVENGAIDNNAPVSPQGATTAAFEVVKATVQGKTGEYFVWVVYNGVEKVRLFVPQSDEKENEQTRKESTETGETGGTEIHVKPGQTVVLEVRADSEGTSDQGKDDTGAGSIEIELVDTEGKPYTEAEVVHLFGENITYTVPIDRQTGKGQKENIAPGDYELALRLGVILFDVDKDQPTQESKNVLDEIGVRLSTSKEIDFKKIRIVGYDDKDGSQTHNETLCLKRAVFTKNVLAENQQKIKKDLILTKIGGQLPGDGDEEKKVNRKVDVFGILE
jgi:outer membrane protein OmpA-like peptidoglycan-associated protein